MLRDELEQAVAFTMLEAEGWRLTNIRPDGFYLQFPEVVRCRHGLPGDAAIFVPAVSLSAVCSAIYAVSSALQLIDAMKRAPTKRGRGKGTK